MEEIRLLKKAWGGQMIRPKGRGSIPNKLLSFGRHLVYAEGTKTEIFYVEDLRLYISEQLSVDKRYVDIVAVEKSKLEHTVSLVKYAIRDVKDRLKKGESIDYVWIFYDKDEYKDFDEAYALIQKQNAIEGECYTSGITWFACWSNESFEVWLYHYFENLTTALDRKHYEEKINFFLKRNGCKEKYEKTRTDIHHFLEKHGGSIEKATELVRKKDPVNSNIKPNPSSGIYQFAEYVLAYINDKKEKKNKLKKGV